MYPLGRSCACRPRLVGDNKKKSGIYRCRPVSQATCPPAPLSSGEGHPLTAPPSPSPLLPPSGCEEATGWGGRRAEKAAAPQPALRAGWGGGGGRRAAKASPPCRARGAVGCIHPSYGGGTLLAGGGGREGGGGRGGEKSGGGGGAATLFMPPVLLLLSSKEKEGRGGGGK
nr:hypothetical protein [Morchella crassipes]